MGIRVASPKTDAQAIPKRKRVFKRQGARPTDAEKSLVKQFVADQPREITPKQVRSLASLMRRSKDVVQRMVDQTREDFASSARDYFEMHKSAVKAAVENVADAKSLDAGIRGAQWALEHISLDGHRVVDPPRQDAVAGTRVLIGVKLNLGGKADPVVDSSRIEVAESTEIDSNQPANRVTNDDQN